MTWREETIGAARLILGDCRDILPTLPRVDAVVTDPPWNCNFFGPDDDLPWPDYAKWLGEVLAQCEAQADGQAWFLSTKSIPHVSYLS